MVASVTLRPANLHNARVATARLNGLPGRSDLDMLAIATAATALTKQIKHDRRMTGERGSAVVLELREMSGGLVRVT